MFSPHVLSRLLATCLLSLSAVLSLNTSAAHALLSGSWSWPLSGVHSIIRDYQAPERFYAPGHRGIDFPADVGEEVHSPADGVVHFVGVVVDRPVISLDHGGYLSSFEPVDSTLVEGAVVKRGDVIGTVATGGHCACVHMGARRGSNYLSPLALLSSVAPAVLLPWN